MKRYEYQVVPAPKKGEKAKGAKTTPERFAAALTGLMNRMGMDGWDYIRADTLPCDERVGLTGTKTQFQNMLVFRREMIAEAVEMLMPSEAAKPYPPIIRAPKTPAQPEALADLDQSDLERMDGLSEPPKPGKSIVA